MTLPPWRTLQNVIQTQKCEPCQLHKPTTPFLAGAFHLTQPHPHAGKRKHGRSSTVMPWTTTDEFNVIPKTQRMSLASFPGHSCINFVAYIHNCSAMHLVSPACLYLSFLEIVFPVILLIIKVDIPLRSNSVYSALFRDLSVSIGCWAPLRIHYIACG